MFTNGARRVLGNDYILRARARCASAVNLLLAVRTSHDVIASL